MLAGGLRSAEAAEAKHYTCITSNVYKQRIVLQNRTLQFKATRLRGSIYRMLIYAAGVVALLFGICSARDAVWGSVAQETDLVKSTKSNGTFVAIAEELGIEEAT